MADHLLLDKNTFLTRFGVTDPRNRVLRRLHVLLVADPSYVADNPIEWLEDLTAWIFERGRAPGARDGESEVDTRTRLLLTAAEEIPPFAEMLRGSVLRVLMGSTSTHLFTDTGIPTHYGFWRELADRFSKNILPTPPVGREVSRLLTRLFSTEERADWVLFELAEVSLRVGDNTLLDTLTLDYSREKRSD